MKTVYATAVAAALLAASPAAAIGSIDVSELSCEQFTGYDDDNRGIVMMWFEGYYTEEDEDPTIDFDAMASHLAQILIKCEEDPAAKVLDLTDDIMDD